MNKSLSKLNLGPGKSNVIKLYHGSPNPDMVPRYGLGDDTHDYGKGFYLTPDKELAKEWAVSASRRKDAWVYSYTLDLDAVRIFNFDTAGKMKHLIWATEIAKHREVNMDETTMRYYDLYRDFLNESFGIDSSGYDVLCGWRADDAYVTIINSFLANALTVSALEQALLLGNLGVQYCCKTPTAFEALRPLGKKEPVSHHEYYTKYCNRVADGKREFYALLTQSNRAGKHAVRLLNLWQGYKGGKS